LHLQCEASEAEVNNVWHSLSKHYAKRVANAGAFDENSAAQLFIQISGRTKEGKFRYFCNKKGERFCLLL